jgi:broad specificity phosphatase PhoE
MELLQPRHLILVRHGESEGDVRRKLGTHALIHPNDEKQTEAGHRQSQLSGRWIAKYIMQVYGFEKFDSCLTSPLIRTKQSAESLGLGSDWTEEPRLTERNRGDIQGLTKQQHKEKFPDSYQAMLDHPFYWVPPGGESILAVSHRFGELVNDLTNTNNVLIMTHRDVLWAANVPLDKLALDKIEDVDTDSMHNGQVIHYTNINPISGAVEGTYLAWKRSINPSTDASENEVKDWVQIIEASVQV